MNRKNTALPATPKDWGKTTATGNVVVNTGKDKQTIIKRNEDKPEPVELIAEDIINISAAMKKLNESKLEKRVILLLIHDITKIPVGIITKVLNAAEQLEMHYIKKK